MYIHVYTICVHLKVGTSLTRTDELQNMTRPVQTYSHKSNPRTGLVVCSVLHTRKIRWGGAGQGWDVNTFTCTCTHTHTVTLHTFSESSHTFLMLRYIRLLYSTLYTCTILHILDATLHTFSVRLQTFLMLSAKPVSKLT